MKRSPLLIGLVIFPTALTLFGCGSGNGSRAIVSASSITPPVINNLALYANRKYQSAVTLTDGTKANLDATVDALGNITGTVTLDTLQKAKSRLVPSVPVFGIVNPFSGIFALFGEGVVNGLTVSFDISGLFSTTDETTSSALWKVNGTEYHTPLLRIFNDPVTPPANNPGGGLTEGTLTFSSITGNVTGTSFTPAKATIQTTPINTPLGTVLSAEVKLGDTTDITRATRLFDIQIPLLALGKTYTVGDFNGNGVFVNYHESTPTPGKTFNSISGTVTYVSSQGNTSTFRIDNLVFEASTTDGSGGTGRFTANGTFTVVTP